ncbi:MAG: ATPase domain-containing protein [Candidatus Diapherotrites archaeon]
MNRVKTGIYGLDELIEGGFPQGRSVLLTGACGTGKTIFGMQYLYYGAEKYSEPGIYITLDERPDLIRQDMLRFGWDIQKFEEKNMIQLIDASIAKIGLPSEEQHSMPSTGFDLDKLLLETMRSAKRIGAKRVVFDSIPALGLTFETQNEVRKAVLKLSYLLSKLGVTSILTTESAEENIFSKYGVEEYVADGVLVMHYMGIGTHSSRTIHIRKMRATNHSEKLHPMEITEKGIEIKKVKETYKEV